MPRELELVTVYIASNQVEAEIVKGRLETDGIPAVLRYESAGLVYGITVNGLAQVEVQVPSSALQTAREILQREYHLESNQPDQ